MRRAVWILLSMVSASAAHADPELTESSEERSVLTRDPQGPWLTLEPIARPNLQGLAMIGSTEDPHRTVLFDGRRGYVVLDGTSWTNDRDLEERGWHAGIRIGYDLGPLRVDAYASVNYVDTAYGRGHYRDLGISIGRTVRLSRWMTGWIALRVGQRKWLVDDKPPAGEQDGTEVMLSIGTTFR